MQYKTIKMSSNEDDHKTPVIQDPIVPHENYDITSSYDDNIIPGPPIKHKSLFKAICEAPTGLFLAPKTDVLIYTCTTLLRKSTDRNTHLVPTLG